MPALDSAIIEEYTNSAIPADRIVADPHLAAASCDAVSRRLPDENHADHATVK